MFLDPTAFSFTALLEACFEPLRDELSHLHRDDFLPWPDRAAYGGDWRGFPLFLTSKPEAFVFDEAAHQARMPASMAALRAIPRLRSAALSWMEPGAHIYAHTDIDMPKLVRAHLGVRVPVGAALRV
jgi:aspartyl/asparaginyl beta-hydroxylase (cupin superfamily)